jgi:hypothetical protein
MRVNVGSLYLRRRTVRALYLIAGSFTLLVIGVGIALVIAMAFTPTNAGDLPIR